MNEWLNGLKVGDSVVVRDQVFIRTAEGARETIEPIKDVTDTCVITDTDRIFKRSSGYVLGGADLRIVRKFV